MTELHQRHVEGVNPDDVEIPHVVDNDNVGEVLVNNNDNINDDIRNNYDNNQANINNENMDENLDEVRAFDMISRFPYSYAKYSLTIFKFANISSPIYIMFSILVLYYTWEEKGFAPFCFRLFLYASMILSFINIPIRYQYRNIFIEITNSQRRRATMLTRRLGRNKLSRFNKYLSIFTYSLIAYGFLVVFFGRSSSSYLKYSVEFIAFSMFGKAIFSAFLLFYYLKDAFEYGDGKELTNEEISVIESHVCKEDTEEVCSICWCAFKRGENLKSLPCPAHHTFHDECIDNWIRKHTTCPICRNNFSDFIFGESDDSE